MSHTGLSDVSFSSGMSRHKYGNTMTQFSDDGRIITSASEQDYGGGRSRNEPLPPVPDYRSYDANRERRRYEQNRRNWQEQNKVSNWREREARRERERETQGRDFYTSGKTDYRTYGGEDRGDRYGGRGGYGDRGYEDKSYDRSGGKPDPYNRAPVYGRTLPLPLARDGGPPMRRFDDYRSRELRPNYEKSHDHYNGPTDNRDRMYDWRMPFTDNRYDQSKTVPVRNHDGRFGTLNTRRTTSRRERPLSWFFVVSGVLLLICGLVNLLVCVPNYFFCFLWMGPLTIHFGITGVVHGGKYKRKCENLYYCANGVLLTVAAMVASGIVLYQYIPEVKQIAEINNHTEYYSYVDGRSTKPIVREVETSTRVWLCLAFDSAGLIFVISDYMALYGVILVAHLYWNYIYQVGKSIEPYCRPKLFNPFMELLWGELLVLVGLVSVFGCSGSTWHKYWSAVGAGLFITLTGGVSAWASKIPNRTSVSGVAILFNLLGVLVSVLVIVIHILGLKDNIEAIALETSRTATDYKKAKIYASAVIFAVVLAVALICFFYCLGLLVRFSYYTTRSGYDRDAFTTSSRSDQTISTVRQRYEKDRGFDTSSDPPLPFRSNQRQGFFSRWR